MSKSKVFDEKDRMRIFWREKWREYSGEKQRERGRDLNGNMKNYHKRERERI